MLQLNNTLSGPTWNTVPKDSALLENAQKFGLTVCLKDWSSSYDELLSKANLPPLSQHHSLAGLCHIHKIIHKLTDFSDVPVQRRSFTTAVELTILYPLFHSAATLHSS